MEFNNKVVRVEIFREEEQVSLIFNELRELKINLSDPELFIPYQILI